MKPLGQLLADRLVAEAGELLLLVHAVGNVDEGPLGIGLADAIFDEYRCVPRCAGDGTKRCLVDFPGRLNPLRPLPPPHRPPRILSPFAVTGTDPETCA